MQYSLSHKEVISHLAFMFSINVHKIWVWLSSSPQPSHKLHKEVIFLAYSLSQILLLLATLPASESKTRNTAEPGISHSGSPVLQPRKMDSRLKIKTGYKEEDVGDEPVSPTGQYFNSNTLSIRILSIMESEYPIDDSCALSLLQDLFLPINPRFSSIMVFDKTGVKLWKKVEVNIPEHLHIPIFPEGLSLEEYDEYYDKYVTEIAMKPLPKDKPLWEAHIIKYPTTKAAGHLIFKLHHALGDGFSLMGALLSCMQRADDPSLPVTFPSVKSSSEANSKAADEVGCLPKTISAIYNTTLDYGFSVLKSSLIADDRTPIRSGDEGVEFHPVQISTVALSLNLHFPFHFQHRS